MQMVWKKKIKYEKEEEKWGKRLISIYEWENDGIIGGRIVIPSTIFICSMMKDEMKDHTIKKWEE